MNPLSICRAVADMCGESMLLFAEITTSIGKVVARMGLETGVSPPDVSSVKNQQPTNDPARGNTLHDHQQRIENLPKDIRIDRDCSEAGFLQTVVPGQCFVTVGDTEMSELGVPNSCREYTLPRDHGLTRRKGWIRENTKSGPVLDVTVSYYQGYHGNEIRIRSLSGDGPDSWVGTSTVLNKYVMEMPDVLSSNLGTKHGASSGDL